MVVVERSTAEEVVSSWYRQNEITIVMSLITTVVPNLFDVVSLLEDHHPRKAMRWMLGRIMALNLLSLYTLIFALFGKTDTMITQLALMQKNSAAGANYGLDLEKPKNETESQDCFNVPISCEVLSR